MFSGWGRRRLSVFRYIKQQFILKMCASLLAVLGVLSEIFCFLPNDRFCSPELLNCIFLSPLYTLFFPRVEKKRVLHFNSYILQTRPSVHPRNILSWCARILTHVPRILARKCARIFRQLTSSPESYGGHKAPRVDLCALGSQIYALHCNKSIY
jgi:hypothetical protein